MKAHLLLLVLIHCLVTNSGGHLPNTQKAIVFTDVTGPDAHRINFQSTHHVNGKFTIELFGGKSQTQRLWGYLHQNCRNNPIAKGMIDFGMSKSLGLGTIMQITDKGDIKKDLVISKTELGAGFHKLSYRISKPEHCLAQQEREAVGSGFLNQFYTTFSNPDLISAMKYSAWVSAGIDSWQFSELDKNSLSQVLNGTSAYVKQYRSRLTMPDRYIISKIIEITGFSATITTPISRKLKEQLQKGIVQNIGNTSAQAKFSYVDDKTLKMTTIGKFVIFSSIIKAKR